MNTDRTTELLRDLNSLSGQPDGYAQFLQAHGSEELPTLCEYLNEYISAHKGLELSQIIRDSNLSKNYAHQFFNGYAKHPDKYKLIPICIAMHMSVKATDRALFLAGQPRLYAKDHLDAALIICINRRFSMIQTNEFLEANGLRTLGES